MSHFLNDAAELFSLDYMKKKNHTDYEDMPRITAAISDARMEELFGVFV